MNKFQKIFWFFSIAILIQSFLPINNASGKLNNTYIFSLRLDYLIHIILFIVLMVLFKLAYFSNASFTILRFLLFVGLGILLAVALEAVQLIVPYRSFTKNDMIANLTGVFISMPFIIMIQVRK